MWGDDSDLDEPCHPVTGSLDFICTLGEPGFPDLSLFKCSALKLRNYNNPLSAPHLFGPPGSRRACWVPD